MNINNLPIREAIQKKRLKYFEVAQALGVSQSEFSHMLQYELHETEKKRVLDVIEKIKL